VIQESHNEEQVLAQLKAQTVVYIELPFNTGDFLLIAHYKLIGHYRQRLKILEQQHGDSVQLKAYADKRIELEEEVLFQLDKVLALTLLTEEQLLQLRSFKTFHEQLLEEANNVKPTS
jgi:hypothetical protein